MLAGCRSAARFEAARAAVVTADGAGIASRWTPARADLAVGAEVEALADELAAGAPLDLCFVNAGIHDVPHRLTADGHDQTYAANFLGHFRLLHRLAAAGRLAPAARIVVSQSQAVHSNPFSRADLDALERPGRDAAAPRSLARDGEPEHQGPARAHRSRVGTAIRRHAARRDHLPGREPGRAAHRQRRAARPGDGAPALGRAAPAPTGGRGRRAPGLDRDRPGARGAQRRGLRSRPPSGAPPARGARPGARRARTWRVAERVLGLPPFPGGG